MEVKAQGVYVRLVFQSFSGGQISLCEHFGLRAGSLHLTPTQRHSTISRLAPPAHLLFVCNRVRCKGEQRFQIADDNKVLVT